MNHTWRMFIAGPFVIAMYYRLARKAEKIAMERFADRYREDMERTPMFVPRLLGRRASQPSR